MGRATCSTSPSPAPPRLSHFPACAALALLAAACPCVLVTATEPIQITSSFIPSDTGCGHNRTHLVKETLRVAGRGNGSPHLVSARVGSTRSPRPRAPRSHDGDGSSCVLGVQTRSRSQRVNAAGVQTFSKQHRWELRAAPLSESWQTN